MLASGDDAAVAIGKNLARVPGSRLQFFPWIGQRKNPRDQPASSGRRRWHRRQGNASV